jgi:hypothetical protein
MAEPRIRRRFRAVPVTIATAAAGSTALRWDEVAGGSLLIGTSSQTTTVSSVQVQLWASTASDGTYSRLYDASGSAADLTIVRDSVNSTSYALPDACYGVGALKLVAGSTHLTTGTVMLKT